MTPDLVARIGVRIQLLARLITPDLDVTDDQLIEYGGILALYEIVYEICEPDVPQGIAQIMSEFNSAMYAHFRQEIAQPNISDRLAVMAAILKRYSESDPIAAPKAVA